MSQGSTDVLKLRARGKAKISERAGTVSLQADDPIGALQAIARQASIKINLTPEEVVRVSGAGKLVISLSYANNLPGASDAAKKVFDLAGQALAAQGKKNKSGPWKIIGFVGLLAIVGVAVFFLAYKALEKALG